MIASRDRKLALLAKLLLNSRTQRFVYGDLCSSSHHSAGALAQERLVRDLSRINRCRSTLHRLTLSPSAVRIEAENSLTQLERCVSDYTESNDANSTIESLVETLRDNVAPILSRYAVSDHVIQIAAFMVLYEKVLGTRLDRLIDTQPTVPLLVLSHVETAHWGSRTPDCKNRSASVEEQAGSIRGSEMRSAILLSAVSMIAIISAAVLLSRGASPNAYFVLMLAIPIFLERLARGLATLLQGVPSPTSAYPPPSDVSRHLDTTAVIVPVLLASDSQVSDLLDTIRINAERQRNVRFVVLTDFADSLVPSDSAEELATLAELRSGLERLTVRHGNRFVILHRDREFSISQRCFIGRERKRGKIHEFNRAILTKDFSRFSYIYGDVDGLTVVAYCLVLDEDSVLEHDTLSWLLRAQDAENDSSKDKERAIFCPSQSPRRDLVRSWGIGVRLLLQFAPRTRSLGQDLFDECVYSGKGLYKIAAYEQILVDKLPDEKVLSHDTIEGSWLNPVFVSQARILDSPPNSVDALLARSHRWARGDVQNAVLLLKQFRERSPRPFGPSLAVRSYLAYMFLSRASIVVWPFVVLLACDDKIESSQLIALSLLILGPGLLANFYQWIRGRTIASRMLMRIIDSWRSILGAAVWLQMSLVRSMSILHASAMALRTSITGQGALDWRPSSSSRTSRLSFVKASSVLFAAAHLLLVEALSAPALVVLVSWVCWPLSERSWISSEPVA